MLIMFSILYHFRARYLFLIIVENEIKVFKYDICKFREAFLVTKACEIFIGKSSLCDLTGMIDGQISDYDCNTILVAGDDNEYIFISAFEIKKLSTEDKTIGFHISYVW